MSRQFALISKPLPLDCKKHLLTTTIVLFLLLPATSVPDQSPSSTVQGRVVDKHTGAPVPGATIHLYPSPVDSYFLQDIRPTAIATAITNADGAYRFDNLAPANYLVARANTPGYADGILDKSFNIRLRPAEIRMRLDFLVEKGPMRSGRLTDPEGNPIPNAKITTEGSLGAGNQTQLTDTNGNFTLYGLPDRGVQIIASATGFVSNALISEEHSMPSRIRASDTGPFVITLARAFERRGRIVDENQQPLAKVTIEAGLDEAISAADGTFVLKALPAGPIRLDASPKHPALGIQLDEPSDFTVVPNTQQEFNLVGRVVNLKPAWLIDPNWKPEPTATTGYVVDERGKPVQGIEVTWPDGNGFLWVNTNDAGFFAFSQDLRNESNRLRITVGDREMPGLYESPKEVILTPGSKDNRIVVKDLPRIAGKILAAETGAPITTFSAGSGNHGLLVYADPEGHFDIRADNLQATTVWLEAEGFATTELEVKHGGKSISDLAVKLERARTLRGHIYDDQKRPIPDATIFGPATLHTRSNPDGSYELTPLAPGTHTLRIHARDNTYVETEVTLTAAESTTQDFTLQRTTNIPATSPSLPAK